MWSSPNSIKETAASFKKFYKSMMNHDKFKKLTMNVYAIPLKMK